MVATTPIPRLGSPVAVGLLLTLMSAVFFAWLGVLISSPTTPVRRSAR